MADKNICEEVQIAFMSDKALTDEQKNHIECCEECKALLSQVNEMKKDLGEFSVPGIEKGQIADRVMEEIKKQKVSSALPKFRLTHHLGTAAAVAVILVAALIIKNPSDMAKSEVSYNDAGNERAIEYAEFGVTMHDAADEEEVLLDTSEQEIINDSATADGASREKPPVLMKSARPKAPATPGGDAPVENAQNEVYNYYTGTTNGEAISTDILKGDCFDAIPEAAPEAEIEESAAIESQDLKLFYKVSDDEDGALGGAGGGAGVLFSDADGWRLALPSLPDGMTTAFDGIEFLFGEENFDYNINLANSRIYELFGKQQMLTREFLSECGCTSNAEFLIFINDGIGYVENE